MGERENHPGTDGAREGKADQVVQHQHCQAAEQQPVEQGHALVGGEYDGGIEGNVRAQLVFRFHAQVNIQRLIALGQR